MFARGNCCHVKQSVLQLARDGQAEIHREPGPKEEHEFVGSWHYPIISAICAANFKTAEDSTGPDIESIESDARCREARRRRDTRAFLARGYRGVSFDASVEMVAAARALTGQQVRWNTRLIRAVVADGRLYDRAALDDLLRDAGSSAAR